MIPTEHLERLRELAGKAAERGFHAAHHRVVLRAFAEPEFLIEMVDELISSREVIADVDTKPNAKHIAFHCPSQMKHLYSTLERAIEVIKFYSEGGHPNMDVWKHENLGYFTGKRAREFLASIEKRGEG